MRGQNGNPACFFKGVNGIEEDLVVSRRGYFALEIFSTYTYHVLFVSASGALYCPV